MNSISRRAFAGSAVALGVGAAVGVPVMGAVKTHGPVKIWTNAFWSKKPVSADVKLFADLDKDVFGVRVLYDGKETGVATLPLETVRWAVANEWRASVDEEVTVVSIGDRRSEKVRMDVWMANGVLNFLMEEKNGDFTRYWLDLADVRRVL